MKFISIINNIKSKNINKFLIYSYYNTYINNAIWQYSDYTLQYPLPYYFLHSFATVLTF